MAERCVRGCHIKCECFPLSNLITDSYGGISQHTERQSKRIVIGLLSFKVIYGICGIITARGNVPWATERLTRSDWFNVRSSGGICTILTFPWWYFIWASQTLSCGFHNLPDLLIATVQDDGMIENFVFSINET